jgi:tryptophan synthase alpha subunit
MEIPPMGKVKNQFDIVAITFDELVDLVVATPRFDGDIQILNKLDELRMELLEIGVPIINPY